LGTEVDMIFNYEFDKAINIKIGYSQFLAGRSMTAIKGGDNESIQNWAWCMLTIKPTLLSTTGDKK
jgi:hypothetical protein